MYIVHIAQGVTLLCDICVICAADEFRVDRVLLRLVVTNTFNRWNYF